MGISAMTCTEGRGYEIIRQAKRVNTKVVCIAGGFGPSSQPEKAIENGVDVAIIGEGIVTIKELMTALENGSDLSLVKGIAYLSGNKIVKTPSRALIENLDEMPFANWQLVEHYKRIQVRNLTTTRGCPYDCDFCSVTCFYGRTYQHRSAENAVKYIQHATIGHRRDVPIIGKKILFIGDDNFAANPNWTIEVLERLDYVDLSDVSLYAQLRAESCRNSKLMALLAKKFKLLFFGFEACDNESLQSINKKQTVDDIIFAIEECKRFGIGVAGMFILGLDDHNPESAMQMAKFALKHGVRFFVSFIRCPLPNTRDTEFLDKSKRLLKNIPDYYRDAQYVMFKPANMTPAQLQMSHIEAIRYFYDPWRTLRDRIAGRIDNNTALYRLAGNIYLNKQAKVVDKYINQYLL
ncbi:MAG: radical SAM protein [Patescibacteria group bacterium]